MGTAWYGVQYGESSTQDSGNKNDGTRTNKTSLTTQSPFFELLPPEIFFEILFFLDTISRMKMLFICKDWYSKISNSTYFWNQSFRSLAGDDEYKIREKEILEKNENSENKKGKIVSSKKIIDCWKVLVVDLILTPVFVRTEVYGDEEYNNIIISKNGRRLKKIGQGWKTISTKNFYTTGKHFFQIKIDKECTNIGIGFTPEILNFRGSLESYDGYSIIDTGYIVSYNQCRIEKTVQRKYRLENTTVSIYLDLIGDFVCFYLGNTRILEKKGFSKRHKNRKVNGVDIDDIRWRSGSKKWKNHTPRRWYLSVNFWNASELELICYKRLSGNFERRMVKKMIEREKLRLKL